MYDEYAHRSTRPNRRQRRRCYVFKRDRGVCYYCAGYFPFDVGTIEHLVPKAVGGTDDLDNLRWCCRPCNWSREEALREHLRARDGRHYG